VRPLQLFIAEEQIRRILLPLPAGTPAELLDRLRLDFVKHQRGGADGFPATNKDGNHAFSDSETSLKDKEPPTRRSSPRRSHTQLPQRDDHESDPTSEYDLRSASLRDPAELDTTQKRVNKQTAGRQVRQAHRKLVDQVERDDLQHASSMDIDDAWPLHESGMNNAIASRERSRQPSTLQHKRPATSHFQRHLRKKRTTSRTRRWTVSRRTREMHAVKSKSPTSFEQDDHSSSNNPPSQAEMRAPRKRPPRTPAVDDAGARRNVFVPGGMRISKFHSEKGVISKRQVVDAGSRLDEPAPGGMHIHRYKPRRTSPIRKYKFSQHSRPGKGQQGRRMESD
jgi:hypothetical protein